jgi:hypothetical protein
MIDSSGRNVPNRLLSLYTPEDLASATRPAILEFANHAQSSVPVCTVPHYLLSGTFGADIYTGQYLEAALEADTPDVHWRGQEDLLVQQGRLALSASIAILGESAFSVQPSSNETLVGMGNVFLGAAAEDTFLRAKNSHPINRMSEAAVNLYYSFFSSGKVTLAGSVELSDDESFNTGAEDLWEALNLDGIAPFPEDDLNLGALTLDTAKGSFAQVGPGQVIALAELVAKASMGQDPLAV